MAWPDLSNILTELRYQLDETTASLWSDTELYRHINDAQRDIAAKTGCYDSIISTTTTANSRLVAFSGYKVKYAEYIPATGNPIGLAFITPKMLGNTETSGLATPQYCFQWGSYLVIDPIPQASYTLNLYVSKWPEYDMVSATDEPMIPVEFHESIIPFAYAMAMIKAKRSMSIGMALKQYSSLLQLGRQIYVDTRTDRYEDVLLPDYIEEEPNVE